MQKHECFIKVCIDHLTTLAICIVLVVAVTKVKTQSQATQVAHISILFSQIDRMPPQDLPRMFAHAGHCPDDYLSFNHIAHHLTFF